MRKSSSFVENQGNFAVKRTPKQNHNPKQVAALQQTDPRQYRPLGQNLNVVRPSVNQEEVNRLALQQRNLKKLP